MKRLIALIAGSLVCLSLLASSSFELSQLRTNGLDAPKGIDPQKNAVASWFLNSAGSDCYQQAFNVRLQKNNVIIWDSGRVESDNSTNVTLDVKLEPNTDYIWYVRVWDNNGKASQWHSAAFSTGLDKDGWNAKWIGHDTGDKKICPKPVYFQKDFSFKKGVKRAVLYVTSRGIYEFNVNGLATSDNCLTPGWTSYGKTLQYQAYDVTNLLKKGENHLNALVAPGWYSSGLAWGAPEKRLRYGSDVALFAQMEITFYDGSTSTICTDESWQMSLTGPVTDATIYDGESIDPSVGFDWKEAAILPDNGAQLVSSISEPVKIRSIVKPVRVLTTPKGEKVIDFGQNLVGWERVHFKGAKGQVVKVTHAEVLDGDGNFYTTNLRQALATSTYTLSGEDDYFEPRHTFYGFRYIRVEGLDGELNADDFCAAVVNSAFEEIGTFECSNALINQLQSNIRWGFHGNFVDVPTDCPQRDERMGWTGDAQVFCRTALYNGNVKNFYRKWLKTLADDQLPNGGVPRVIPDCFFGQGEVWASGWADCATLIPWRVYMASGDVSILEEAYPAMKNWVNYQIRHSRNHLLNTLKQPFGDWLFWSLSNDPSGKSAVTSKHLLAQSFMAASLDVLVKAAKILGNTEDVKKYEEELKAVKKAYLDEYVTPNGLICSDTQTAYVLALYFDLLPEQLRPVAARRLAENVAEYKDHITTGFLGTPHICEVLSRYGYNDVAYRLLLQDTCPSWIYPVKLGATTIWERWNSINPDGSIVGGMNSFNHYSYGAIGDWLYRYTLGIRETSPGYKTFEIDPTPGGDFTYAQGSTVTPHGKIFVHWDAQDNRITRLFVTVPAGTTATIHTPDGSVVTKGSGTYEF